VTLGRGKLGTLTSTDEWRVAARKKTRLEAKSWTPVKPQ
jgi:hypothetical protein